MKSEVLYTRKSDLQHGQKFGRWTVVEYSHSDRQQRYWKCECACGNIGTVSTGSLKGENSKSCGCLNADESRERFTKHGLRYTLEYKAWQMAKNRVTNSNCRDWFDYGGRGIRMCKSWLDCPAQFYADMGPKPDAALSLDRINVDGDYEPSNCRWANNTEQANNKRSNREIVFNGERKTVAEWARVLAISSQVIRSRLVRGWPVETALTAPVGSIKPRRGCGVGSVGLR